MQLISPIQSLILDLPPSCIEFCSVAPDYFVVGTYFLERKEQEDGPSEPNEESNEQDVSGEAQKRSGSLIVFQLDGNEV